MFKLKAKKKIDADSLLYSSSHFEFDRHTVHMLTQRCLLPHWQVQWSRHCSSMHIPVHSFWLPGYIDVMQTVLYINNVWTSLDRPRTCTWMNVQHYWSVGKHKLKSQWDTTTHLLEWLKCKRLIIPCIGEDLEALLMGIQYRIDLETSFSVS